MAPKKSPAKRAASPKKASGAAAAGLSPRTSALKPTPRANVTVGPKNLSYKVKATRDSDPMSANPDLVMCPKLGNEDGAYEDDVQESAPEMKQRIGRRLTKMDRKLLELIDVLESDESIPEWTYQAGRAIFAEEMAEQGKGKPLNCHANLYWRFHRLWHHQAVSPHRNERRVGGWRKKAREVVQKAVAGENEIIDSIEQPRGSSRSKSPAASRGRPSKGGRRTDVKSSGKRTDGTNINTFSKRPLGRGIALHRSPSPDYEGIPRVDHAGIVMEPLPAMRATPRKGSKGFAKTPTPKSRKRGRPSPAKRAAVVEEISDDDDEPLDEPPAKRCRSRPRPTGHSIAAQSSSTKATATKLDLDEPLPDGVPSAPGRGAIKPAMNPQFIPGVEPKKRNPFFETMPAPEIWHRRMAPYFPFGETPFTERVMSNQINEDLAKSHEENVAEAQALAAAQSEEKNKSMLTRGLEAAGKLFGRSDAAASSSAAMREPTTSKAVQMAKQQTWSPWLLPEVAPTDVFRFVHGVPPPLSQRMRKRAASKKRDEGVLS